jgi:nucleolar GTP-binding protein
MLQRVPVVAPPAETLASALKRASRVTPSAAVKNEAEKARHRAARALDTLMKELSVPLTRCLSGFPKLGALHPFEAALLDLTVGRGTYTAVLGKVQRRALRAGPRGGGGGQRPHAAGPWMGDE